MDNQQQGEARTEPKAGLSPFVRSSEFEEWFRCVYCRFEVFSLTIALNHTLWHHFKKGVVCNEVLNDGTRCPEKFRSPEARNDHRVEVHGRHPPGYQYRPDKTELRRLRGPCDPASVPEFLADFEGVNLDGFHILRLPPALGYVLHFAPGMGLPYYRKTVLRTMKLPMANFPASMKKEKSLSISKVEDEIPIREIEARLRAMLDAMRSGSKDTSHNRTHSLHMVPNVPRSITSLSAGPTESSSSFDDSFDATAAVLTGDVLEGSSGSHSHRSTDEIKQNRPSSVHGYHPYRALAPPKAPTSQSRGSSVSLFGPFSPSFYGRALEDETH